MLINDRLPNILKAHQAFFQSCIQSTYRSYQKESRMATLVKTKASQQQLIPSSPIVCSRNFESLLKQHDVLGYVPQTEYNDFQTLLVIEFSKSCLYSDRALKNLFFRRNIQTQRLYHLQKIRSAKAPFMEWPNFTKNQTFQLLIPHKDQENQTQVTIQIRREDLSSLKDKKAIPQRLISSFLIILRQMNMLAQNLQIAPFSFITTLFDGLPQGQQSEETMNQSVIRNYRKASKCLKVPIYDRQYTAIPFLMSGHYSMFIIRGMPRKSAGGDYRGCIYYCSSRSIVRKQLFTAMKIYLQCQIKEYCKDEVRFLDKNMFCTQLILPREVAARDSGLFLMLFCQNLLGAGREKELTDIKPFHLHPKLHIFPVSLVYEIRAFLWNMFCKMANPNKAFKNSHFSKLRPIEDYLNDVRIFEDKASFEQDYSKIDVKEMAKLSVLAQEPVHKNEEELLDRCGLEYFYHSEINYYEQQ